MLSTSDKLRNAEPPHATLVAYDRIDNRKLTWISLAESFPYMVKPSPMATQGRRGHDAARRLCRQPIPKSGSSWPKNGNGWRTQRMDRGYALYPRPIRSAKTLKTHSRAPFTFPSPSKCPRRRCWLSTITRVAIAFRIPLDAVVLMSAPPAQASAANEPSPNCAAKNAR
jgi:hypothetical protein